MQGTYVYLGQFSGLCGLRVNMRKWMENPSLMLLFLETSCIHMTITNLLMACTFQATLCTLSLPLPLCPPYSMVVLYISDHKSFGFSAQKYYPKKPASQYLHGTLAVLVRYNQAQKCLQYNLKHLFSGILLTNPFRQA